MKINVCKEFVFFIFNFANAKFLHSSGKYIVCNGSDLKQPLLLIGCCQWTIDQLDKD